MSALLHSAPPGAVAVVRGPAGWDSARAIAAASAAFTGPSPELITDGPLVLAWLPSPGRAAHTSETTVCLLEGAIYAGPVRGPEGLAKRFEQQGEGVLDGLRGDFWLLLWDRRGAAGIVAADHLGSRTPYWSRAADNLILASEVPELLAALPSRPAPDPLSLAHWLAMSTPHGGATLFSGVRRFEAAHMLVLGDPNAEPRRYWEPRYDRPLHVSREEAAAKIRSGLTVAVERRLDGVSKAGVRLSGGIDSSSVTAVAANVSGSGWPHAYSATFPDHPSMDEAHLIGRTVEHLGIGSTRMVVRTGSVIAGALGFLNAWQLPPASPNLYFWIPLLARAAGDGTRVLLDGEGGDETFSLSPYLLADRLRHGRVLSAIALTQRIPTAGRLDSIDRVWRLIRRFGLKGAMPPAAHLSVRRLAGAKRYAAPWLSPALGKLWIESEESAFGWKRLSGPRWWSHLVESITRGLGPALVYEQSRRLMAQFGLEARHPLVDVDLVELVLKLPPELAFDRSLSRPLLRDALAGLLPDEVRLRRGKSNFDALFHGLISGPELPLVRRLLGKQAELGRYVDLEVVERELLSGGPPRHPYPLMQWAVQVWRMVSAECWLRTQADSSYPARTLERERLGAGRYEFMGSASPAAD